MHPLDNKTNLVDNLKKIRFDSKIKKNIKNKLSRGNALAKAKLEKLSNYKIKSRVRRAKLFIKANTLNRIKKKIYSYRLKIRHNHDLKNLRLASMSGNIYNLKRLYDKYVKKPSRARRENLSKIEFAKAKKLWHLKSLEDTHNQGEFKWNGEIITFHSNLNPAGKLKRMWSNYVSHIPLLSLRKPFRFDHAILYNYRLIGKLMTFYYNKRDKAYDLYYDVGTHERLKVSTKNLWSVEQKQLFNNISFNRRWSINIYNSYTSDLILNPIDTQYYNSNGLYLENNFYASWHINPLYDIFRLRNSFFRPIQGSVYTMDFLRNIFSPKSNTYWLTLPHTFETFFMSSFFESKEVEYTFRFFRILDEENLKGKKIELNPIILKPCKFEPTNFINKNIKLYNFMRMVMRVSLIEKFNNLPIKSLPEFRPFFKKINFKYNYLNNLNYLNNYILLNATKSIRMNKERWAYLTYRKLAGRKIIKKVRKIIKKGKKTVKKSYGSKKKVL